LIFNFVSCISLLKNTGLNWLRQRRRIHRHCPDSIPTTRACLVWPYPGLARSKIFVFLFFGGSLERW
jgi:hypothetical protein